MANELATSEYAFLPVRTRAFRFRATEERGGGVRVKITYSGDGARRKTIFVARVHHIDAGG